MARGRWLLHRGMLAPLLLLNLALFMVVLGIAGWAVERSIDHRGVEGNRATSLFVSFSLIAGAVGVASIMVAISFIHKHATADTPSASSSALIAWVLLLIAFGLACKQIHIGHIGTTLKFMEAAVIIVTATHSLYLLVLHAEGLGL